MNGVPFIRVVPVEDIRVRSGGDGRTVEAYAAVFDSPAPITDQEGHYLEVNHRDAFNRTIKQHNGRFPVIYNHGMTAAFTPSERGSVPLGVSVEVRADSKGLLTVSRYGTSELADEVLEAIRNGSITAQSYGGRYLRSDPTLRRGQQHRPGRDGALRTVTRMEVAMHEFGPTPFPAFSEAAIVGVRSLLHGYSAYGVGLPTNDGDVTTPDRDPASSVSAPDRTRSDQPEDPPSTSDEHSIRPSSLRTRVRAARIARGME